MKSKTQLLLVFLIAISFMYNIIDAQIPPKVLNFYKVWENALYPLQHSLTTAYWTAANIDIIEKLPGLEKNMNETKHPEYFTIYPKILLATTQPSLLESTTISFPLRLGLKTRSQEA